eukprot:SAG31_NODE_1293_length_8955_cov_100.938911_4_plen_385_part_00
MEQRACPTSVLNFVRFGARAFSQIELISRALPRRSSRNSLINNKKGNKRAKKGHERVIKGAFAPMSQRDSSCQSTIIYVVYIYCTYLLTAVYNTWYYIYYLITYITLHILCNYLHYITLHILYIYYIYLLTAVYNVAYTTCIARSLELNRTALWSLLPCVQLHRCFFSQSFLSRSFLSQLSTPLPILDHWLDFDLDASFLSMNRQTPLRPYLVRYSHGRQAAELHSSVLTLGLLYEAAETTSEKGERVAQKWQRGGGGRKRGAKAENVGRNGKGAAEAVAAKQVESHRSSKGSGCRSGGSGCRSGGDSERKRRKSGAQVAERQRWQEKGGKAENVGRNGKGAAEAVAAKQVESHRSSSSKGSGGSGGRSGGDSERNRGQRAGGK